MNLDQKELKITTYVIIGGCGFLGQHLIHFLLNKNNNQQLICLKIIDKIANLQDIRLMYPSDFADPRLQLFLNIDISTNNELNTILADTDVIFYLAALIAYGRKNKELLYNSNVKSIENVITHSKKTNVKKLIYVSSFATLGCLDNSSQTNLATEDCKNDWKNEKFCYYGLSKYQAEKIALKNSTNKLKITVAIPGILIGPGFCKKASLLPFQVALQKKWAFVPQGGSNYIDVRDVALGLMTMATSNAEKSKFLLVSNNITHANLLNLIAKLAGHSLNIIEIPRFLNPVFLLIFSVLDFVLPADFVVSKEGIAKAFKYRYYSHQKAKNELAWSPQFTLEETITDSLQWFKQHGVLSKNV